MEISCSKMYLTVQKIISFTHAQKRLMGSILNVNIIQISKYSRDVCEKVWLKNITADVLF